MKTERREKIFFNRNKFFVVHVTVLWPAEDKHLDLTKLMNSIEAPVQE